MEIYTEKIMPAVAAGRHFHYGFALFLAFALVSFPCFVSAENEPSGRVVMIASRAQEEASKAAIHAIEGQLSDLVVDFRVHWEDQLQSQLPSQVRTARSIAGKEGASVIFWFDFSLSDQIFLYLSEPGGGRILVRSVEHEGESARFEAVALIVRATVKAMLQGGVIGVQIEQPAPAPAASTRRQILGLELAYALNVYSPGVMHGINMALAFKPHRMVTVFAAYCFHFPVTGEGDYASTQVFRHPFLIGTRLLWSIGRFSLGPHLAVTIDYVTQKTTVRFPDMIVNPDTGDVQVSLSPMIHFMYRPIDRIGLFLDAGAEIFMNSIRYVADGPEGREVVLAPWRCQPKIHVGFSVSLF